MLCTVCILFNDRTSMNSTFEYLLISIVCILRSVYYVCLYSFWHLRAIKGLDTKNVTFKSLGKTFDEYLLHDSHNGYELDSCTYISQATFS